MGASPPRSTVRQRPTGPSTASPHHSSPTSSSCSSASSQDSNSNNGAVAKRKGMSKAVLLSSLQSFYARSRVRCMAVTTFICCCALIWLLIRPTRQSQHLNNNEYDLPTIPEDILPKSKWVVPLRFLRPHNTRLVREAKLAITGFGNEIRHLMRGYDGAAQALLASHYQEYVDAVEKNEATFEKFRQRLHLQAKWLRGDSRNQGWPLLMLPDAIDGRALVIGGGDRQCRYMQTLVYAIRTIHGSSMPIRVVYRDEHDLTEPSKQKILGVLTPRGSDAVPDANDVGIQFIDLSQYFDLDVVELNGWNLKAYGMLAVAETEVVSIDSDVMLFQPPEKLFEAKGYQETGALFFHDRVKPQITWNLNAFVRWLKSDHTMLSSLAEKLLSHGGPLTGCYTEHIQEAGVILIDKKRRALGLWAACLIFGRSDIRKYAQTYHMYGDKEIYWSAFETFDEPYEFSRFYPGVVGEIVSNLRGQTIAVDSGHDKEDTILASRDKAVASGYSLCGRMVHFNDKNEPLWSNGGYMLKDEDYKSSLALAEKPNNPILFIDGGDSYTEDFPNPLLLYFRGAFRLLSLLRNQNQVWTFVNDLGSECMSPNARSIQMVKPEVAKKARDAAAFYFQVAG